MKTEAVVQRCSVKKVFLEQHLYQSRFFNKVEESLFLLKKIFWHRSFPVNFAKFLRTPFFRTPLVAASGRTATQSQNVNIKKRFPADYKTFIFASTLADAVGCSQVFCRITVLKNSAKCTGKRLHVERRLLHGT